jgi:uncharacterized protein (TIGR02996 family)
MPTDEQRALWTAIRAHPDDDTPRLVYADWLQENGDEARAEFIRTQIESAKLPSDLRKCRKARKDLRAREEALLAAHKPGWVGTLSRALDGGRPWGPASEWYNRITFARGFIRWLQLEFDAATLLVASGIELDLIEYFEIRHDRSNGSAGPYTGRIASWAAGSCVDVFGVSGATDEDVRAFLAGGQLTRLRQLDFWWGSVTDSAIVALARSPLLATVKTLTLTANAFGDEGALALARSPHLSRDATLLLFNDSISGEVRQQLRARFNKVVF